MFLGIDLGTSSVKAVLVDGQQKLVGQASAALDLDRPQPLWSEQDPEAWWTATNTAMAALRKDHGAALAAVEGVGLSGQMHGATLLDRDGRVLRPAILWNDGRSEVECVELERREPSVRGITGNLVMPGFTAPKLLWVAKHEPAVFKSVAKVLLPKDYLRYRMTGQYASDMSDSAGTLWVDVAKRAWSPSLVAAADLPLSAMPELFEGSQPTGTLSAEVANAWGVPATAVVAGGAGDNAAGAIGAGVIDEGASFLSLGTSGVIFVADDRFLPNPQGGVHAFCHALPGRWHRMSVMLSAAACLSWITQVTAGNNEAAVIAEAGAVDRDTGSLLFLPYLTGERTPHNDPNAKGVFFGLDRSHERADVVRAVLEGVAFGLADGQAALLDAGAGIADMSVIGGGARSPFWGRLLASILNRPLTYHHGADLGPAFGAARLARLAVTGEDPAVVCRRPPVEYVVQPIPSLATRYVPKHERFRALYRVLKDAFRDLAPAQTGG